MRRPLLALLLGFLSLGAILSAQSRPASTVWRISEAPADFKRAISTADSIIVAQHSALVRQLARTINEGGPGLAIESCHLEATNNSNWVGRRKGYAVGRTSDRLRSPTNRPTSWAAPIVKEYAGQTATSTEGFVVDLGDRVGVMRPITMRPLCQGCHGPSDKIGPAVRTVLKERYPVDHAIGFKLGEIRGWYRAEIPKVIR